MTTTTFLYRLHIILAQELIASRVWLYLSQHIRPLAPLTGSMTCLEGRDALVTSGISQATSWLEPTACVHLRSAIWLLLTSAFTRAMGSSTRQILMSSLFSSQANATTTCNLLSLGLLQMLTVSLAKCFIALAVLTFDRTDCRGFAFQLAKLCHARA